jgi:hypothetical protein
MGDPRLSFESLPHIPDGNRTASSIREKLVDLVGLGPRPEDAGRISELLWSADRKTRVLVLELLARARAEEVASSIVSSAASNSAPAAEELIRLVSLCPGPKARGVPLEALRGLIAENGIGDHDFHALLFAIAEMDWTPDRSERSEFAQLARAIGPTRLIAALDEPGKHRLGSLRLLVS